MRLVVFLAATGILTSAAAAAGIGSGAPGPLVPVTPDNFPRAESDLHLSAVVKDAGLAKFRHQRKAAPPDRQFAPRADRDTFTSDAVFDLEAGPVTITLPEAGARFISMQVVDEDGYTAEVVYGSGRHVLSKDRLGTRYVLAALRIYVNADDPKDVEAVGALQDAVKVDQPGGPGAFQIPNWDAVSQVDVRTGLRVLAETLPNARGMFGSRGKVDPVRRLIGTGVAWGGLPDADARVMDVTPERNDGWTVYRIDLKDAPVDGFWSISVYNDRGFFEANPQHAYSVNSVAAKANPDGSVTVQFGGCDGKVPNCLPTPPDWSYTVRLYRPRAEVLNGAWSFPEAKAVEPPPRSSSAAKIPPSPTAALVKPTPSAAPARKPTASVAPGKKTQ